MRPFGTDLAYLMQRWRQGDKVSMVTKDGVVK